MTGCYIRRSRQRALSRISDAAAGCKYVCLLPALPAVISNIILAFADGRFGAFSCLPPAAAVCEELFFRGLILKSVLLPRMRPAAAIAVSAVLFGTAHFLNLLSGSLLVPVLFQMLYAFCFSVWAGAVVYRQGSILIPLCVHVLINLTAASAEIFWLDAAASALFLFGGLLIASGPVQAEARCASVSDA